MKIIALLPFKNEAAMLPSYLSSVTKVADEVIALNDHSSDQSEQILKAAGATVIQSHFSQSEAIDMSKRRTYLLELGRKREGTHFIWLDADETFSANFIAEAREVIEKLQPGQKLSMRWVHAWKNTDDYLDDPLSPFGMIWKDFIVCDDGKIEFKEQFLSEARTPGNNDDVRVLEEQSGVVLHWQFSRWNMTQYKQALYRCQELLEGSRSARRINNTYSITLEKSGLRTAALPAQWTRDIIKPLLSPSDINYYKDQILALFRSHGIEKFEPLEIWHLEELRSIFVETAGRQPASKVFPKWLVRLNNLRHGRKN